MLETYGFLKTKQLEKDFSNERTRKNRHLKTAKKQNNSKKISNEQTRKKPPKNNLIKMSKYIPPPPKKKKKKTISKTVEPPKTQKHTKKQSLKHPKPMKTVTVGPPNPGWSKVLRLGCLRGGGGALPTAAAGLLVAEGGAGVQCATLLGGLFGIFVLGGCFLVRSSRVALLVI